jgi:outer membrane protein, heavy metal efflux system
MKTASLLMCLFLLAAQKAWSADCKTPTTSGEILDCVRENHPDVLRAKSQARSAELFAKAAAQRVNPEVTSEATSQKESDQPALKLEAAYLHTFEFGGKRSRRIDEALAQRAILDAQLREMRESVSLRTVSSLYRLRQVQAELASIDEALETFQKILGFYKSRRRLSPEQEVSYNVFFLAEADYTLRKSNLLQEKQSLVAEFALNAGVEESALLKALPAPKKDWPVLPQESALKSVQRQEAEAQLALARSQWGIAKSFATPDVRVGPKIAIDSGRGQDSQGIGGALSMSLPLYQRNQGARALAQVAAENAQLNLEQRDREITTDLRRKRIVYEQAVQTLKRTPSAVDMSENHGKMDDLFQRGIVSATLVIEAHRQMVDFIKDQNELELKAVESLWSIYAMEGRILEERL